jgi:alpha-glucosidase
MRDNPAAGPGDHIWDRHRGQRPIHSAHQREVHDLLQRWRRIADEYRPARVLMGATWVSDPTMLARYYGAGDELHLPQNFTFAFSELDYNEIRPVTESWLQAIPECGAPVWLASSHDLSRFPTRWCAGDERKVRLALTLLLTLPGACVLYQGDELGLEDVEVPEPCLRDRVRPSRDRARTPMPWTRQANFGFTTGEPWLPTGDRDGCTVADQRDDACSALNLTRSLIALKRRLRDPYQAQPAPDGCWHYTRGEVAVRLDFRSYAAMVGPAR